MCHELGFLHSQGMELMSSRVLVRPRDYRAAVERCMAFGLRVMRSWGPLEDPVGIVFALGGGGLLELSASAGDTTTGLRLWLQVPSLSEACGALSGSGFDDAIGEGVLQPWGLLECEVELFDGVTVVLVEIPETHPLRWRG